MENVAAGKTFLLLDRRMGEHLWIIHFVKHDTHVDYGTATFRPASKLNAHIASGRAKLKEDLAPEILAKVRAGVVASSHTPNDIARYCAELFNLKR